MSDIIDFNEKKEQLRKAKKSEGGEKSSLLDSFVPCQNCGNYRFNQTFLMKVVTPFEDTSLTQNQVMPITVFECSKCKKILNIYN